LQVGAPGATNWTPRGRNERPSTMIVTLLAGGVGFKLDD